jgi:hypothetical protein
MLFANYARYSEAISVLYTKNKFTIRNSYCMGFLPQCLLTKHFASITSISFQWTCGSSGLPGVPTAENPKPGVLFEIWVRTWHIVASMEGLKILIFSCCGSIKAWKKLAEAQNMALLQPIMAITAPQHFELRLPFACDTSKAPWKDLPCTICTTNMAADSWE